jgi:hypothetical protein
MTEHQLYLNLGENRWLIAHCSCGGWKEERMLKLGQRVSEVVRAVEEAFERHAGLDPSAPYTPALPVG